MMTMLDQTLYTITSHHHLLLPLDQSPVSLGLLTHYSTKYHAGTEEKPLSISNN